MNARHLQCALLFILLIPCWIIASHFDIDLVNLHVAAGFTHTDLSRVYAQNGNYGRWFYPPFSLVLIHPLGAFPYAVVKGFWICLQTIAYFLFWLGLYLLYPKLKERDFLWGWTLIFIVAINPIHNNYQSNNVQLMLMAVLVIAEFLSKRSKGSQILAGVLVSFSAWFKVFPAFMAVYYLLVKPFRVKVGLAAGFLIGLGIPFLLFGIEPGLTLYRDFYLGVTTYGAENKTPDIMCLPTLIERFFTHIVPLTPTLVGGIIKTAIGGTALAFFSMALIKKDSLSLWALAMALTVFLNPSTRPHYFIFYVPAFVSLLEFAWTERRWRTLAPILIAILLVAFTTDAVLGKGLNDQVEFLSLPTIGSAIVTFLLAGLILRRKPEPRV